MRASAFVAVAVSLIAGLEIGCQGNPRQRFQGRWLYTYGDSAAVVEFTADSAYFQGQGPESDPYYVRGDTAFVLSKDGLAVGFVFMGDSIRTRNGRVAHRVH